MIDDAALAAWLTATVDDLGVPFVVGPRIPEFGRADILGVVTGAPGLGLTMEGINNIEAFQLRLVGRERDYQKLKTSAYQVHRALMFANFPGSLWGTWVTSVTTAGGGPVPELGDGTDLDRVAFVCTYLAETEL